MWEKSTFPRARISRIDFSLFWFHSASKIYRLISISYSACSDPSRILALNASHKFLYEFPNDCECPKFEYRKLQKVGPLPHKLVKDFLSPIYTFQSIKRFWEIVRWSRSIEKGSLHFIFLSTTLERRCMDVVTTSKR